MLFAIPVPRCVQLKPFFSEGDLSINLRPSTFLPFQVHYHNVNAPLLAWTLEFSPVNVSFLEPPSSNTLIPPWSSYPCLPSALSIFSISSFSLHSHLQMRMASRAPSNASCRSESTRFFHFVKSVTCFQKSCMWDLLASIASKNC